MKKGNNRNILQKSEDGRLKCLDFRSFLLTCICPLHCCARTLSKVEEKASSYVNSTLYYIEGNKTVSTENMFP
jgi:hypothetical protein